MSLTPNKLISHLAIRKPFYLWLMIFIFRLVNSIIVCTYFDPDEYWQSIEVAHLRVFGYGQLTWDWLSGLRSWVSILPYLLAFSIVKLLRLDSFDTCVIYAPRLVQASIAASIDFCTLKVAQRFYHRHENPYILGEWAIIISLVSWFNFAYLIRTYSNVLESLLTLLALLKWPFDSLPNKKVNFRNYKKAIFWVGLCCLLRPSAALNWIYPGVKLLFSLNWSNRGVIIWLTGFAALAIIILGFSIDTYFYATPTFTWWNFIKCNFFDSLSLYYGRNSVLFYLINAIPTMSFTMLPLMILGAWEGFNSNIQGPRWLFGFALSSLWLNSMIAHKELRFIIPLLPIFVIWTSNGRILIRGPNHRKVKRWYLAGILVSNLFMMMYMTRHHQSGPIKVIDKLRLIIDEHDDNHEGGSGKLEKLVNKDRALCFLFLMPCHSTPWYGYLHRNVSMRSLDCSPPRLPSTDRYVYISDYRDEADRFFANPVDEFKQLIRKNSWGSSLPSHLIMYQCLLDNYPNFQKLLMNKYRYVKIWDTFNAHLSFDRRRMGNVVILSRTS